MDAGAANVYVTAASGSGATDWATADGESGSVPNSLGAAFAHTNAAVVALVAAAGCADVRNESASAAAAASGDELGAAVAVASAERGPADVHHELEQRACSRRRCSFLRLRASQYVAGDFIAAAHIDRNNECESAATAAATATELDAA